MGKFIREGYQECDVEWEGDDEEVRVKQVLDRIQITNGAMVRGGTTRTEWESIIADVEIVVDAQEEDGTGNGWKLTIVVIDNVPEWFSPRFGADKVAERGTSSAVLRRIRH